MAEGYTGMGTVVRVQNPDTSWTVLGKVAQAEPPSSSSDKIDVTAYDSPDNTKVFIKGLKEYGTIPLEIIWIPGDATDAYIIAWEDAGDTRNVEIDYAGLGVKDTFPAFVESYTGALPINDKLTMTATLQVAGARTRTP